LLVSVGDLLSLGVLIQSFGKPAMVLRHLRSSGMRDLSQSLDHQHPLRRAAGIEGSASSARVLDVGCGEGFLAARLTQRMAGC
jgi:2-polyprenyl-3-methyl-5-hydroxy-6-metoxy-1,4-benzoquinol methylase